MEMPKLFQIGDMAKLFHISVSSLRYYESLGLLTPERVDPDTGYRYYSVRQFEVLNTIRYLRELDMPLPEISDFLKCIVFVAHTQECRCLQHSIKKL